MVRPVLLGVVALLLLVVAFGPTAPAASTAQTIVTITVPTPTPRPMPTATPRPALTLDDCDELEDHDRWSDCIDRVLEQQEDVIDRSEIYEEEDHGPRW